MARRRKSERALGPYPHFRKWRVIVVGDGGQRTVKDYESEEEARAVVRSLRRKLDSDASKTVEEARVDYKRYLEQEKQNRARSVDATEWRLSIFFTDGDELLTELTPAGCARYYERLRTRESRRTKKALSVDSHRNILAEAKTFLKWCVAKRWLRSNPLEGVHG